MKSTGGPHCSSGMLPARSLRGQALAGIQGNRLMPAQADMTEGASPKGIVQLRGSQRQAVLLTSDFFGKER